MRQVPNTVLRRLVRFGIVGVGGTVAYFVLLLMLVEVLDLGVMLSTTIAFAVVILQNYVLHYAWTFGSDVPHEKALPQFVAMSGAGFCINWLVMYTGVEELGFNYLLVQAISVALVVIWNFVISHFVVFRERRRQGRSATPRGVGR